MNNTLTAVPGIRVGHFTHLEAGTGCTVVICPEGTVGGVEQRGGAPGTRETDLLRASHLVETVNAAYGLASADGVMRWCEEHHIGYQSRAGFLVPIVPAAIVMDLPVGRSDIRPDAAMGYAACEAATTDSVQQGTVGAGTGCRVGAMHGNTRACKGGIGSAAVQIDDELVVAALVAVNAVGDVLDEQGNILAGLRETPESNQFTGMLNALRGLARAARPVNPRENTVIGVVATNGRLNKEEVNRLAQMADDGIARAVNPSHTLFDGDTMFALATGQIAANVNVVGAYGAEAVTQAIRNAVRMATTLFDVRAINDQS
jgi:L-aminopeptidase/D-esterase-like protein